MTARVVTRPSTVDLERAREVVARFLPPTPLIPAAAAAGEGVSLKLETFQPTGSFKVRGALAAISRLAPGTRIVTASAGNHALGVAWAAQRLGMPATIVVAETSSPAKREALAKLPIDLVVHGADYDEAETFGIRLGLDAGTGATFVSPYNDPAVIAGQSTILDEIVTQRPVTRPLTIVAGVGGGGLTAGLGLRARELATATRPIRVIGVEAAASQAVSAAVSAGHTHTVPIDETIADGLSGNLEPGSVTVELVAEYVDHLVAVSENELHSAIRWLVRNHGIVAEGAGASSVAALLAGKLPVAEDDACVLVISGRNIALPKLASVLAEPD